MRVWQGSIMLFLAFTATLMCTPQAWPQVRDRLNLTFDQLPATEGRGTQSIEVNANHRLFLDDEGASLLALGLQYRTLDLVDRNLQLVVPQLSWLKMLNDEYSLVLNLRPGFFGDFRGDFGRSFRLEGGAVITRMVSDRLTLGLGFGRGSNFARDITVPLLQIFYLPSSTWMVDAVLPVKFELWYLPSRTWEFGGLFNISGSYYLSEDPLRNADRIGFGNMLLGVGVRRLLVGSLQLSVEAGSTLDRRLEWSVNGRARQEARLENGPYARATLNWRF